MNKEPSNTVADIKASLWFFKGEFVFMGLGGGGLSLALLPIFIVIHVLKRLGSSRSDWGNYYGPVRAEISKEELVFWSAKLWAFTSMPEREILRVSVSRLILCEPGFSDESVVAFRFTQELDFRLRIVDNPDDFKSFKSVLSRSAASKG